MGFYSWVFLVFLMKESKKRRRKQPGKLMAKSRSQPVNLRGALPLMNSLLSVIDAPFWRDHLFVCCHIPFSFESEGIGIDLSLVILEGF